MSPIVHVRYPKVGVGVFRMHGAHLGAWTHSHVDQTNQKISYKEIMPVLAFTYSVPPSPIMHAPHAPHARSIRMLHCPATVTTTPQPQ